MGTRKYYRDMKSMGDLVSEVCAWSIQDIEDETLLQPYLANLPSRWNNFREYFLSFGALTLEEVRAELLKSYEATEITDSFEVQIHPYPYELSDERETIVPLDICFPANKKYRERQARSGDVFLLTREQSAVIKKSKINGFIIAIVDITAELEKDDVEHHCRFWVDYTHQGIFQPSHTSSHGATGKPKWYATLLSSISVLKNMRKHVSTLSTIKDLPNFFDMILGGNYRVIPTPRNEAVLKSVIAEHKEYLNESQKKCIEEVLGKNGVHLIHGPPGTGKTTTLVTILTYFFRVNIQILQSAPTNIAVGEVAKKFIQRMQSSPSSHPRSLGDLVLIGDGDRIDLNGPLKDIFLDTRVKRLESTFAEWPSLLNELIVMLDETIRGKQKDLCDNPMNYFQDTLPEKITKIEKCILCLFGDLPSVILAVYHNGLNGYRTLLEEFRTHLRICLGQAKPGTIETGAFYFYYFKTDSNLLKITNRLLKETNRVIQYLDFSNLETNGESKRRRKLESILLYYARIIFSTVGCTGRKIMSPVLPRIETIIVDEATQLPEAVTALLFRPSCKRLILAGDHKQLPSTVISLTAKQFFYGRSLFERLHPENYPSSFLLDTQYRMRPQISEFPKYTFYRGKLKDSNSVSTLGPESWHNSTIEGQCYFPSFAVFDVESEEIKDPFDTSTYNETEANFITKYLGLFANVVGVNSNTTVEVGIITPYGRQVDTIKEYLGYTYDIPKEDTFQISESVSVIVKTIDGSQGQEKDVIIVSMVRANDYGEIGFVDDDRRLNVALTRAKHSCWVICNSRTLTKRFGTFNKLIKEAKKRKVYFNVRDNPNLVKLIDPKKVPLARIKSLVTVVDSHKKEPTIDELLMDKSLGDRMLWKIMITENALRIITNLLTHDDHQKLFVFLIKIAEGKRHKKRKRYPVGQYINLIEYCRVTLNLGIIWTIGIYPQETHYEQVILVYEVIPCTQRAEAIKRAQRSLACHSGSYLVAASQEVIENSNGKSRQIPYTIRKPPIIPPYPQNDNENPVADKPQANIAEDTLTLSKKHMINIKIIQQILSSTFENVELPLDLSEEEITLVRKQRSLFVLGRSGTGKTTVILMRMYKCEEDYYQQKELGLCERKPIQIMFTLSPNLCVSMRDYYNKLRRSIVNSDSSEQVGKVQMSKDRPPSTLEDLGDTAFVCFGDFLVLMDRQLEKPFLYQNRELARAIAEAKENSDEVFGFVRRSPISRKKHYSSGKEVDFARFRDIYWPNFPWNYQKNYDMSIIWTEFQSSIKGSLNSLKYPKGKLPYNEYINIANTKNSTFDHRERAGIYELYEKYEKLKRTKDDWDTGDLTSYIFLQIAQAGYHGQIIDHVYIDEVQDLTPAQMALFKYICKNKDGFIFAGDTAQTISAGVGFRFQYVQELFHKEILPAIDETLKGRYVAELMPKIDTLTQNYRTHAGILKMADSIVDILYHVFPSTIDKLPKEKSLRSGPAPVVLEDTTMDGLCLHLFGSGENVKKELGAQQVIIVRDEKTKEEISEQIETALVLTVFQAKGLEFDDVLCYDFFTNSPFKNWCILDINWEEPSTELLREIGKNRLLCSELKALYVVVTRCKKRLWFFDHEHKNRKFMLNIWKSQKITAHIHDTKITPLAQKSSNEQWKQLGEDLFERRMYKEAKKCFSLAQDLRKETLCQAFIYENEGEIMADMGKLYESRQKYTMAAKNFETVEEYHRAALIYLRVNDYDGAQRMFFILKDYDSALDACLKGKFYIKALRILPVYCTSESELPQKHSWARQFALSCHSSKNSKGVLEFLEHVSESDRRAFLERYKYYDELLQLDTKTERFDMIARDYENKNELFTAAHSWKKHGDKKEMARVLLRIMRPLYIFQLAGISFDLLANLQKVRELLQDVLEDESARSFELDFFAILLNNSPINANEWIQFRKRLQAQKETDHSGLSLMIVLLIVKFLGQRQNIMMNPSGYITTVKECYREFSELIQKLKDTSITYQKYDCYYIFGLDDNYTGNPEHCRISNRVFSIINSLEIFDTASLQPDFSQTEISLSEFAITAQNFVQPIFEQTMKDTLQTLRYIDGYLKPCTTMLLDSGISCGNDNCVKYHDEQIYIGEEKPRIMLQIEITEIATECKHLSSEFEVEHDYHRSCLLEMLNPLTPNLFDPIVILEFKQFSRVNIIFEEYKRVLAEKLNEQNLTRGLLVSQSTSSLIWYDQLKNGQWKDNNWLLWNAFNWLRVDDVNMDPIYKSGKMGAQALFRLSNWDQFAPSQTVIDLSPQFYIPLLERFLSTLIIRRNRLWITTLPTRLWVELICGEKNENFDTVRRSDGRPGFYPIREFGYMFCFFFENNAKFLKDWFQKNKLPGWECRGYILRILSLVFVIYLNTNKPELRLKIGMTLRKVNWMAIPPLGSLREHLQKFCFASRLYHTRSLILNILLQWKDEFIIVANPNAIIPSFMQSLRTIHISWNDSIKTTLMRSLGGFTQNLPVDSFSFNANRLEEILFENNLEAGNGDDEDEIADVEIMEAAPVEKEIEVQFPLGIHLRIRKIVLSVRNRIKRRNAIEHPRDRYAFIAEEHFRKHDISSEFRTLYIETICELCEKIWDIFKKVTDSIRVLSEEGGKEVLIDEMISYKERSEKILKWFEINSKHFLGKPEDVYNVTLKAIKMARKHIATGEEYLTEHE